MRHMRSHHFSAFLQFPNHTFSDGLFDFAQNRTGLDKFTADVQIKAGCVRPAQSATILAKQHQDHWL